MSTQAIQQHKQLILTASKLSAVSYTLADNVRTPLTDLVSEQLSHLRVFYSSNASGFVGVDGNRVWCVFTGTNERRDLLQDVDYTYAELNGGTLGHAHKGFSEHHASVASEYQRLIAERIDDSSDVELIFAGHSLGGAVATLAAMRYEHLGYSSQVFSYGSPRVFSPEAAHFVDHVSKTRITRVESTTDWVADLPTRKGRFPYSHVGLALYINSAGDVTSEDPPWFCKLAQWSKRVTKGMWFNKVHSSYEYVRRLERWAAQ